MTAEELLEKLLESYQSAFDITRPYEIGRHKYDAYAAFCVTSAKYVLVKKAELWRANCFEHTFFSCRDTLRLEDLKDFQADITDNIEPRLVRGGESCTPENHMYTYITGIFICREGISKEVRRAVESFRYFKNYRLGIRGYAQARLLVFDGANQEIFGNKAAKDLVKGYKKAYQPYYIQ
ncbi:hypothetical protein HGO97_021715 [Faecalicatena sp. AGMB00832]|uniref:DUF8052 domain-containing protein n=1 Tax=Faecalicatena faecalis TaxID=2726362 RepID=A0ABS6DB29_9FIRM|nr:hypothetical protein [Faecalicatena faecalis]MBU3878425.1 hypothetical protein [Faecalicatena faecalis]